MNTKKGNKPNSPVDEDLISTKEQLKEFLQNVRDKLADSTAAPVYAMSALNHVMNLANIYTLLDKGNKELARDIWLRLKQAGLQLKNPPMLFDAEEDVASV